MTSLLASTGTTDPTPFHPVLFLGGENPGSCRGKPRLVRPGCRSRRAVAGFVPHHGDRPDTQPWRNGCDAIDDINTDLDAAEFDS